MGKDMDTIELTQETQTCATYKVTFPEGTATLSIYKGSSPFNPHQLTEHGFWSWSLEDFEGELFSVPLKERDFQATDSIHRRVKLACTAFFEAKEAAESGYDVQQRRDFHQHLGDLVESGLEAAERRFNK
jgi:hypothetical protein